MFNQTLTEYFQDAKAVEFSNVKTIKGNFMFCYIDLTVDNDSKSEKNLTYDLETRQKTNK